MTLMAEETNSPNTKPPVCPKTPEIFDICIVGSGAGGAVAAKQLVEAGYRVVMIEKGVERDDPEIADNSRPPKAEDELIHKSWRIYEKDEYDDPTYFSRDGLEQERATKIGGTYDLVGGGTVLYAGAAWRFRREDFKKKSIYGEVPGASVVDWPIDYDDIERSYTEVESLLRISGNPLEDPTDPARSDLSSVLPPLAMDEYSERLLRKGRSIGLKPFKMPITIDPRVCQRLGMCSGYPCAFSAKGSVDVRIIETLKKNTEKFNLRPSLLALRVEHNSRGQCSGVLCKNLLTAQTEFISSRIVILAASAIQTARILLNSDTNMYPDGLGNINGLVGKNLMFHIYSKQLGVFNRDFKFRLNKLIAFHDFYFPAQHGEGFINHCSIQSGSKWGPIKYAKKARSPNWGKAFAERVFDEYRRTELLQAAIEDLPREENRVTLHDKTDMYGMRAPKVIHKYHEMDIEALQYGLSKCAVILQGLGAEIKEYSKAHSDISENYTYHLMGTCRMGHTENDSVLNKYCQSYAVKNLFVVDGSVFPTSAAVNPTLTIQANSHRVAQHIIDSVGRREL